jgi:hypothetical protein
MDSSSVLRIREMESRRDTPIPLENSVAVIRLMAKILVYSAMKIRANKPLLYSTLNPDTSSDSPSAKSKGVRLVSARLVINQRIAIGGRTINIHDRCVVEIIVRSIWLSKRSVEIRISDILTSYEMVWATPRSAPSRAYLEFEHHPAINVA